MAVRFILKFLQNAFFVVNNFSKKFDMDAWDVTEFNVTSQNSIFANFSANMKHDFEAVNVGITLDSGWGLI